MRQLSLSSIDQDTPDFRHLTEKRKFTVTNKRNIPFTGEVYGKIISFSDIIFSPIPQLKCICCGFMGRTFYCHPNLPPYYSWKEKLSKYNFFMLIIGKIDVRERYEDNLKSFKISEWKAGYFAGNEGVNVIKKHVRQRRIETINYLSAFTKIRFCDEGGGCEKAVLPDTKIHLINKEKNAKDIIVGDVVFGYNTSSKSITQNKVLNILKQNSQYKVKITTKSGKVLKVTPEHPVYTSQGWKKAEEVSEQDDILVIDD